jgi:hypothetical protein
LHAGAGIEVERAFRIVVSTGEPSGIAKFMEKAHGDFILIPKFPNIRSSFLFYATALRP